MKVILVEPNDNINIGSVARVMENFGFSKLVLVSPQSYDFSSASRSACWATKILEEVEIVPSLVEAVKDMTTVVGFSSREGKNLPQPLFLNDWLTNSEDFSTTAFLFGPEDTGLTNTHLNHVTHFVRIPTTEKNPSMNLSHAVAVVLYSISIHRRDTSKGATQKDIALAPMEDLEALEQLIFKVCEQNGFFNEHTPKELPSLVGGIFKRGRLSKREVSILQGIFGRSLGFNNMK